MQLYGIGLHGGDVKCNGAVIVTLQVAALVFCDSGRDVMFGLEEWRLEGIPCFLAAGNTEEENAGVTEGSAGPVKIFRKSRMRMQQLQPNMTSRLLWKLELFALLTTVVPKYLRVAFRHTEYCYRAQWQTCSTEAAWF